MIQRALEASLTQSWYHIVVVGTELAGLMYASLAARAGYRVAVIGQGMPSNTYRHEGFTFLREPERFCGFGTSPAVAQVMNELSLHIEMKSRPQPIDPTLQYILPRQRVSLFNHRRHWEREVDRELPGMLEPLDGFDQWCLEVTKASDAAVAADMSLPPMGIRAKTNYRRLTHDFEHLMAARERDVLHPYMKDPTLRTLTMAPLSHLSGLLTEPLSPVSVARAWTHMRGGLCRIPGGLDGLKQIFLRKIREQSSVYRPDVVVDQLTVKRGKATSAVLADRGEEIGCELVVGNMEPRRFLQLIPRDQRSDSFHTQLAGLQPAGWRFTLNLGVDPRVIPLGLAEEALIVTDPRQRLRGENNLWLSRPGSDATPGSDHRPGPGVLQVTSLLESRGAAPTIGAARRLVDRSLDAVRQVIPWLDDHLKCVHAPAMIRDPEHGRPTLDMHHLVPVMGRALPQTLGASPFPSQTAYRNILLGGDLLFSGFGFEGTCLAALQTLRLTRQLVKLKNTIKADRSL